MAPEWILAAEVVYVLFVIAVCLRIIYDTRSVSKTLAYLLLVIFVPIAGIVLYFSFGINYRVRKIYNKKIISDDIQYQQLKSRIELGSQKAIQDINPHLKKYSKIARLLLNSNLSGLSGNNQVQLLFNGEEKFPEVIKALKAAKHHIHMEYYIFEDEVIGQAIKEVLIEKAKEGVQVRFIYDDFGSRSIRKKIVPELRAAGVQAFPFFKIFFILLANRLNYRNHRKIIIVDGHIAFTGGINISDRYINDAEHPGEIYWRDTHIKIVGPAVHHLQHLFISDWNFCADENLEIQHAFFEDCADANSDVEVQIAASGPDSDHPTILFNLIQAIGMADEEILITTPYFIPGNTLLDALYVAALSDVKIKLLVPYKSDSMWVAAAARSYYQELLNVGVEIFMYKKGFIHAKTMVIDDGLSFIGTANMDERSFELNFEVNTVVYDQGIARQLKNAFYNDLNETIRVDAERWAKRSSWAQLPEKIARLFSPLL
ncbi:cardiolipin synthetase [Pedobacter sp. BAL39]|uniref:cardiolipin synthase n=1 Tax=Pedobacter sp. BAL39 TaxID=391596 RepID=UPI000155972C|nr:cardiolipin synthase [Pedobacter sp. BAL39]EDM36711.1 cardiolipin synthetase [Pedobacter sp. BAL39]